MLLPALLAVTSCTCLSTTGPDAGSGPPPCWEDSDCPDSRFFFCNTVVSQCQPACLSKAGCTAAERGEFALEKCDGPLGCNCDEGLCEVAQCGRDADCGAERVCRDGACVTPPPVSAVGSCEVVPSLVAARSGSTERFTVLARSTDGSAVVLSTGVTWSAVAPTFTLTGASGPSALFDVRATANDSQPVTAVRASFAGIRCEARALVFGEPVPLGQLDVVVTDAATSRPVTGATVVVTSSSGTLATGSTSTAGFARLSGVTGGKVSVNAFHPSFDWLTVAGYDVVTGTRALALPLRRSATSYGGRSGTVTGAPLTSSVLFGALGLSFGHSFTEVSRAALEGPRIATRVKVGTLVDTTAGLGSGVYASFAGQPIKEQAHSFGATGVCLGDEAATVAGQCGTRTAWAFTADVPLGAFPLKQFAVEGLGLDDDDGLSAMFPMLEPQLRRFGSSVSRDVAYSVRPSVVRADGSVDLSHLTALDQPWSQVRLGLVTVLRVPELPRFQGAPLTSAVVLGGALVPERGFSPLGLGLALDSNGDGRLDGPMGSGRVRLRSAPPHHGLEELPYVAAIWARSARPTPLPPRVATAGAVVRIEGAGLGFDPTGATPIDFPAFAALPESGTWSPAARTFGLPATAFTDESALVVTFKAADLTRWTVVVDPREPSFTLSGPPGGFEDRTAGAKLRVEALRLAPEQSKSGTVAWRALVEHGGVDLDDLLSTTVAFAVVDEP